MIGMKNTKLWNYIPSQIFWPYDISKCEKLFPDSKVFNEVALGLKTHYSTGSLSTDKLLVGVINRSPSSIAGNN